MEKQVRFEELCPFVREAGMQSGDSWQLPRRIYDHELLYCLSGRAVITIGTERQELAPGHLAIVPPDTPHTLVNVPGQVAQLAWMHCDFIYDDDGGWIYRWYNTPEDYVRCFAERLPFPEYIRPAPVFPGNFRLPHFTVFEDGTEMEMLFRSLVKAFAGEGNHFSLLSRVTVLRVLDAVLTQCGYWKSSAQPIRVSDAMKQYIRFNYMNRITLEEIGASTQYSPDYAGRLFRKETGITVIEYLNHLRTDKAQTLLLDESLPMSEIAE